MQELSQLTKLDLGSEVFLPSSRKLIETPHFVGGRYPCRSVAYIPRMILSELTSSRNHLNVLDPFMGSGTTGIEAAKLARRVFGVEVDPYARLIATVATRIYSPAELAELERTLATILEVGPSLSPDQSQRPTLTNIEYWFHEENFDDFLRLKQAILQFSNSEKARDFFLSALGDIVRACSKAERQSLKPYISTKYTKVTKRVFPEFHRITLKYLGAVSNNHEGTSDGIEWIGQDATNFISPELVDIAITSPPYINAMDYTRCIKLESAWIGTANDASIKDVKSKQLGEASRRKRLEFSPTVVNLAERYFAELEGADRQRYLTALAFFDDMSANFTSVHRALRDGGQYFVIIGNSTIRGIEIPTHLILANLAEHLGFRWKHHFYYKIKDHRTSIPRGDRGGKIESEHVIGFEKL